MRITSPEITEMQARAIFEATSQLLNEGEKEILEITFTKPGKYPFICTFPGHAQMMRGHFIVK